MDGNDSAITFMGPLQRRVHGILRQLGHKIDVHNISGRCRGCMRISIKMPSVLRIGFETDEVRCLLFMSSFWRESLLDEAYISQLKQISSATDIVHIESGKYTINAHWDIARISSPSSPPKYTLALQLNTWVNMTIVAEDETGLFELIQAYIKASPVALLQVHGALENLRDGRAVAVMNACNDP